MFTYVSTRKLSSNQFSLALRDLKGLPGNGVLSFVICEVREYPRPKAQKKLPWCCYFRDEVWLVWNKASSHWTSTCKIIFGLTICFWGPPETGMAIKIKTTQIGGEGIKTSSQWSTNQECWQDSWLPESLLKIRIQDLSGRPSSQHWTGFSPLCDDEDTVRKLKVIRDWVIPLCNNREYYNEGIEKQFRQ